MARLARPVGIVAGGAALLTAIISSNAWNRLLISIREPAGTYRPG